MNCQVDTSFAGGYGICIRNQSDQKRHRRQSQTETAPKRIEWPSSETITLFFRRWKCGFALRRQLVHVVLEARKDSALTWLDVSANTFNITFASLLGFAHVLHH